MSFEKKYNPSIDLLRIISILSVLLIHVTTKTLELAKYDLTHHPLTLFFNQAPRFAVPIFFLVSAFVLELNYSANFNYFSYLKRRLSRLILPYIFWSVIYYFFVYTNNSHPFALNLLSGESSYQLYFIPTLLIFYLLFPFIHQNINKLKNKFSIIILAIVQLVLLSVDYYVHPLPLPYPVSVFLLNFDLFIVGILVSRHQKNVLEFIKKYRFMFLSISIILAFFITFEGRNLYLKTNNYLSFYSQWRPSIFVYSLVFGGLMFSLLNKIKFNLFFIKKIASFSFFVYFIHVIFIEIIYRHFSTSLFFVPALPFLLVIIFSYFSAYLLSKIPRLSKFTG